MNVYKRFNINENDTDSNTNTRSELLLSRQAEQHVATLLRCMDYTFPTPKFNMIQIRALTCVLLDMVLIDSTVTYSATTTVPLLQIGRAHV